MLSARPAVESTSFKDDHAAFFEQFAELTPHLHIFHGVRCNAYKYGSAQSRHLTPSRWLSAPLRSGLADNASLGDISREADAMVARAADGANRG